MKPPAEGSQRYYATHRVRQHDPAVWQRFSPAADRWEDCAYEDIPDTIWRAGVTRDGWRFYTDRLSPFPGSRVISNPETQVEPTARSYAQIAENLLQPTPREVNSGPDADPQPETGQPSPETRVFWWDYKDQPPLAAMMTAAVELSQNGHIWACEIETGGDCYAWVISDRELTEDKIRELTEG